MPKLELDDNHIYRLDGRIIPSATDALSLVDDRRKDPYFLLRGKYLHKATELWDRGELDEDTVDSSILGRLDAWKLFRKESGFVPSTIEQFYVHPQYLYGFRPDCTGLLNGVLSLIDKKSSPHRIDALQGAAYWGGLVAQDPPVKCKKVFDVYLKENGNYNLVPVKFVRNDFLTFLAILTAYRWKEGL